jgi:predicted  nucleic acid-binding Zn-ribbon protein
MRTRAMLVVGIAAILAGIAATRPRAQEQPGILPALLVEVRGLRAAIEQMASAGPRVQLALGRLQLQEQRLNTLIMKLDATREKLANSQRQASQHQWQLTRLEAAAKEAPNAEEREQANHMLTVLKGEIADAQTEVQRLTAEEASTASEIASEQNRWSEFNTRLEELEKSLVASR